MDGVAGPLPFGDYGGVPTAAGIRVRQAERFLAGVVSPDAPADPGVLSPLACCVEGTSVQPRRSLGPDAVLRHVGSVWHQVTVDRQVQWVDWMVGRRCLSVLSAWRGHSGEEETGLLFLFQFDERDAITEIDVLRIEPGEVFDLTAESGNAAASAGRQRRDGQPGRGRAGPDGRPGRDSPS